MQHAKYYHKLNQRLNQRLNQYGGVLEELPIEIRNLITCNLNSCKDIILFAGTNKKTYDAVKKNIKYIVRYFKVTDPANRELWNEFIDTGDFDQNYINFIQICKRLELVRSGMNISNLNRDIDLTTEKLKIIKRLRVLGLNNDNIIDALNNFQDDNILLNIIFLIERYRIRNINDLIMIAPRSVFALGFINLALNHYRISLLSIIGFIRSFNDNGIHIAMTLLDAGINVTITYNIIFNRFRNITTEQQFLENIPLIDKILSYKQMGFNDFLLLELLNSLNTPDKELRFIQLINEIIPGTNVRLSQNIALDIIRYRLSNIKLKTLKNLIINEVEQKYAYYIADEFTIEQIQYFFELKRIFNFNDQYAYMSIVVFNQERERINTIINYNRNNGFTIAQAFTIERQFTQEMKELIVLLITANYPGDIIYSILTDGNNDVDKEIDSDWENIPMEQINTNIEHINQLTGEEFGFNSLQAFQLMHTPIENITLLRQNFNVENSFNSRDLDLEDIQLMVRLKTELNFSEEYAVMALSNLTQHQIDIMIELKSNNIEDEYCYRMVTLENYNEEIKEIFLSRAREYDSAFAFEFIQGL